MAILIVVIYQLLLIIGRYSATRCHGGGRPVVAVFLSICPEPEPRAIRHLNAMRASRASSWPAGILTSPSGWLGSSECRSLRTTREPTTTTAPSKSLSQSTIFFSTSPAAPAAIENNRLVMLLNRLQRLCHGETPMRHAAPHGAMWCWKTSKGQCPL